MFTEIFHSICEFVFYNPRGIQVIEINLYVWETETNHLTISRLKSFILLQGFVVFSELKIFNWLRNNITSLGTGIPYNENIQT
jgi:hypothetical protein